MNIEFLWFINRDFPAIYKLDRRKIDKLFLYAYLILDKYICIHTQYTKMIKQFDPSKIVLLLTNHTEIHNYSKSHIILLKHFKKITLVSINESYQYCNYNFIYSNKINSIVALSRPNKINIVLSKSKFFDINDLIRSKDCSNFINFVIPPKVISSHRRICSKYGIQTIEEIREPIANFEYLQLIDEQVYLRYKT